MSAIRPLDALDTQVAMMRFFRAPSGRAFIEGFQQSLNGQLRPPALQEPPGVQGDLAEYLALNLNEAQTYVVYPHIVADLWHRAGDLAFQPLLPQDLPDRCGFVLLEQNLYLTDRRRQTCSIKGILWSDRYLTEAEGPGLVICTFSDKDSEDDDINKKLKAAGIHPTLAHSLLSINLWRYGTSPLDMTYPDDEIDDAILDAWRLLAFCQQLWAFAQDQIPRRMPAYRAQHRRLMRAHSPLVDVKVVDLRPMEPGKANPDAVHQEVIWSHRWRQRKHLRRQWYPSLGIHKVIEVAECIKGPEFLPLIDKDTVMRVKR